ncbi:MAG TPA: hypothetical protein VND98_07015 [Solirubrobacterales bacterium]|nr:hypothetical protein [Solirubrobacterales bacterium]
MKAKLHRPSLSTVIALIALFVSLGGTAIAFGLGRDSVHSENIAPGAVRASALGKLNLRVGKIHDFDTTAGDGVFNVASGHAQCKRGERLISGGLRLRKVGGVFPGQHVSMVDSGPVPKLRQWFVTLNSDLGGAARQDFVVFAYCLAR